MNILGICGSLRPESSNARLLRAARTYLHAHVWNVFDLTRLPFFDPARQFDDTPAAAEEFRAFAGASDLILIATPEYAHGIPGVLKNGLEWLFCEATIGKPVAVILGSGQGQAIRDQLLDVLRTMDFAISPDRFLLVQGAQPKTDAAARITDPDTRAAFEGFLDRMAGTL
jgi:NAD(P)H-dependent FMN reductase